MDFKQALDLLASGHKVRRKHWTGGLHLVVNAHNIMVRYSSDALLPQPYRPDWQDLTAIDWGVYSDA